MKLKKINFKSKGFGTLAACLILSVGAISMVLLSQPKVDELNDFGTSVVTKGADVNVTGIKDTTAPTPTVPADATTVAQSGENEMVTLPADDTNVPFKSFYAFPVGEKVGKLFSDSNLVFSITMGDYRSHNGVDFDGNENDTVKAINDGIVMNIATDDLWGTIIEMDHGNKMIAKYCGLKSTTLKVGDFVKQDTPIGTLGAIPIESADGTHLHLEIKVEDKIVSPMAAMSKE